MFLQLLLGLLGGALIARWFAERRAGNGPLRLRRPNFHPGQLLFLARELRLDDLQREQVKDILHAMRRLGMETRVDQMERMEKLAEAMGPDRFERERVELAITTQLDKEAQLRREIIDRIELFHNGLTAEQRAKLQQFISTAPPSSAPDPEQHTPPPPGAN